MNHELVGRDWQGHIRKAKWCVKTLLADLPCKISMSTLERCFHQEMGMCPMEFARRDRMAYACELLATTRMKLYEMAPFLGYSSEHHLTRAFTKFHGFSPRDYRKELKNGELRNSTLQPPTSRIEHPAPSIHHPNSELGTRNSELGTRNSELLVPANSA